MCNQRLWVNEQTEFRNFSGIHKSFDIICITETKNKTIPTDEIYGYKCINYRTGGIYGISILVKDNLYNDIMFSGYLLNIYQL